MFGPILTGRRKREKDKEIFRTTPQLHKKVIRIWVHESITWLKNSYHRLSVLCDSLQFLTFLRNKRDVFHISKLTHSLP